jgi:hypothetical protein
MRADDADATEPTYGAGIGPSARVTGPRDVGRRPEKSTAGEIVRHTDDVRTDRSPVEDELKVSR